MPLRRSKIAHWILFFAYSEESRAHVAKRKSEEQFVFQQEERFKRADHMSEFMLVNNSDRSRGSGCRCSIQDVLTPDQTQRHTVIASPHKLESRKPRSRDSTHKAQRPSQRSRMLGNGRVICGRMHKAINAKRGGASCAAPLSCLR